MAKEKFKLLKICGKPGGFCQTWQAEVLDPGLRDRWGQVVAIKIPLSQELEKALIQEIALNFHIQASLKQMQHPHIVRYLGHEKYDNQYVMVMEYVEGRSLRERIGEIGEGHPLPVAEAVDLATQVCQALIAIHNCNIVHRDIKPENILLSSKDGLAKVSDLGVGRLLLPAQLASTYAGSFYYMPKEMLRGRGVEFSCDIYSLGVVLYEMLTGKVPFLAENISQTIEKICSGIFTPPKKINPEVDDRLNAIVLKAMNSDAANRYQTAQDFCQALEDYLAGPQAPLEELQRRLQEIRADLGSGGGDKALKAAAQLVKDFADLEKTYLLVGDSFCRYLQYEKAVEYLRAGVEKFPQSAALRRMLAICLYQLAKSNRQVPCSEALAELEVAVSLAPDANFAAKTKALLEKWQREVKVS